MRKILCVCVLMWALCGSAFAGDIQSPPVAPQKSQVSVPQEQVDDSIIYSDNADTVAGLVLDLFAVMQSLF